jgi:LytS/YehU family sensor histidine kinase
LQTRAGTGTGLANIRSRLVLLYGSSAHLSLANVQPHGLAATISMPWSTSA